MQSQSRYNMWQQHGWLIGIVLMGFALRVYAANHIALNNDEFYDYARWISHSFYNISVGDLMLNNQVFAHILDRSAILLLGDAPLTLRWPAILLSTLGIALIYRLTRLLFGATVAVTAAFLLAISPFVLFFANTARGYTGVIVLPMLCYLLAWFALRSNAWPYWIALAVAAVLTLYTHLFTALALATLAIFVALYAWRQSKPPYRALASATLAAVMLLLLYAPLLREMLLPTDDATQTVWVVRPAVTASLWNNWLWFNGLEEGSYGFYTVWPFLALLIIGGVVCWRERKQTQLGILLGWTLLPFGMVALASLLLPDFWARPQYLGYTLPPLLILIAVGLVHLSRSRRLFWLGGMLALALLLGWGLTLQEFYRTYTGNWAAMGQALEAQVAPGDLIVCQRYQQPWRAVDAVPEDDCTRTLNYWRLAHMDDTIPAVRTSYDLVYQLLPSVDAGIASRTGRVWLVVWDMPPRTTLDSPLQAATFEQFDRSAIIAAHAPQSYAANLATALAAVTESVTASEQRYSYNLLLAPLAASNGDDAAAQTALESAAAHQPNHPESAQQHAEVAQLVRDLSPTTFEQAVSANFANQILLRGYTLTSEGAPSLAFFWEVLAPIEQEYTIFLHLRDAEGNTLYQFDHQPFYGNYPTTLWQPGQRLSHEHQLQLTEPLPAGQYQLVMGFYNPDTQQRLPLLDADSPSELRLTTLTLP